MGSRTKNNTNFTGMKVDKALVDKLANLSKLTFDADEEKAIEQNLTDMLNFVGKLDELDVTGVEPLIYVNPALKNAPLADSDYFKVPKVLRKK